MRKLFLPIKSIEKFIYEIVIEKPNPKLKRIINDKYFQVESLDTLASEHRAQYSKGVEHPDKKFYFRIRKNLEKRGIDELMFVHKLADDIMEEISFEKFSGSLKRLLSR